jgi:hypothetical protein
MLTSADFSGHVGGSVTCQLLPSGCPTFGLPQFDLGRFVALLGQKVLPAALAGSAVLGSVHLPDAPVDLATPSVCDGAEFADGAFVNSVRGAHPDHNHSDGPGVANTVELRALPAIVSGQWRSGFVALGKDVAGRGR